jgi:hypothetical protein
LSALQKYLEVLDEDLESAISTLKFWRTTTTRSSAQTRSNLELGSWTVQQKLD